MSYLYMSNFPQETPQSFFQKTRFLQNGMVNQKRILTKCLRLLQKFPWNGTWVKPFHSGNIHRDHYIISCPYHIECTWFSVIQTWTNMAWDQELTYLRFFLVLKATVADVKGNQSAIHGHLMDVAPIQRLHQADVYSSSLRSSSRTWGHEKMSISGCLAIS